MTVVEAPPARETFPTHLVHNCPVHEKPTMPTGITLQQYVKHAKAMGIYQVFETAIEAKELSALELAELASELIRIQKTNRAHWGDGMPLVRNRRTGKFDTMSPFKSPRGILGDNRDPLIAALLEYQVPWKKIRDLLSVSKAQVESVHHQLQIQSHDDYEGEVLMPYYRVTLPDQGGKSDTRFAESEDAVRSDLREELGAKRLPSGTQIREIKAPKGAWRDLPNAEKAAYLLEHPTVPDHAWTEEKRLSGESRSDFIARLLG